MTPDRIAEMEALIARATKGPWVATPMVPGALEAFCLSGNLDANNQEVDLGDIRGGAKSAGANAALIVWLVNNAPDIIRKQAEEIARKDEALQATEVALNDSKEPRYSAVEEMFMQEIWEALKGDHADLRRQQIILRAYREAGRAAVRAALEPKP